MVGLLDIAPITRRVSVNGQDIEVRGLSAKGIAYLIGRFPEVRALFDGRAQVDFTPERLLELVPDAIAAIIASSAGEIGNKDAEAVAEGLPAQTQLELLSAIIDLTLPQGAGPFVASLEKLMGGLADSGKAPRMKSQPQSKP